MRLAVSDWGVALAVALGIHIGALAIWMWAPRSSHDAGAGWVSIALAPSVAVTDDRAETQATDTEEVPPPIDQPVQEIIEPEPVRQQKPPVPQADRPVERRPQTAVPQTAPASAAAPANAVSSAVGISTGSAQGSAGIASENAIASYKALIADRMARHKRYPRSAQRRRQEGIASLQFTVQRDGTVTAHKIIRSAGFRVLDREVENTLARAAPFPPFPPDLAQDSLEIVVPIRFELIDN